MECDFRSSLKQEVMRATNSRAHFLMRWPQANKSSQPQLGSQISDSPMNSRHSSNGSILSSLREWYINEFLYRFWHAGTVCKSKKKKIQLTSFKTVPSFKNKDLETASSILASIFAARECQILTSEKEKSIEYESNVKPSGTKHHHACMCVCVCVHWGYAKFPELSKAQRAMRCHSYQDTETAAKSH